MTLKRVCLLCGLLATLPAAGGVIVTEQSTQPDGAGGTRASTRTTYVEGGRQAIVDGSTTTIIDLDKRTMLYLDAAKKTATEMALDANGPAMQAMMGMASSMTYKASGVRRTVAGYACEEYTTSGQVMGATVTTRSCISKDAPGAAEYAAFGKRMMKAANAQASAAGFPEGMVLATEASTVMGVPPGMPPEVARMMAAQMANQGPQVSRSTVTAVKVQAIPAATFAVPAGYTLAKPDTRP